MTENTKIALSSNELELVCNTNWILTKHVIIQKVYSLFGELLPQLEATMMAGREQLPQAVFINPPKISKGENYKQLPYVMLDYPRYFSKDDSFAIRTFFWWGNFFSVNLQLSGVYKDEWEGHLVNHFSYLQQNAFWVCVNDDPWEHHFEDNNYVQVKDLGKEDFGLMLRRESFVKIGKKISLQQWQEVPVFIANTFDELIRLFK